MKRDPRGDHPRLSAAYAVLLRAYSRAFRAAWGDDMAAVFRARCVSKRREGGRLALFGWVLRAALDVAWNAPQERISSRRGRTPSQAAGVRSSGLAPIRLARAGSSEHLRSAWRVLLRSPGLTATLVLTLALGTGATTALFTVVDGALLRPLPYPDPDRLVLVRQASEAFGETPFAPPYLEDLRQRIGGIEALSGFSPSWELTMTETGDPRTVSAAYVADGLLELFGVVPLEGRLFTAAEHAPDGPRAAVLGADFRDRVFGPGEPVSGRVLALDGEAFTVVGVVPSFSLPITTSIVDRNARNAELWLPFSQNPFARLRSIPVMNVVGRLPAGGSIDRVRSELPAVAEGLERDYPDTSRDAVLTLALLHDVVTATARRSVLTLFGAAALLLLIACANVANLLLARATARSHEIAVRRSLGADRGRILGQLLTESLLLALLGSGAGLLLAVWLVKALGGGGPAGLPPSATVAVDLRAAAFAGLLALATTVLFGLVPALQASRTAPAGALRGGRDVGAPGRALRGTLVTAEIALAVTLLAGAGLLARSFHALTSVDPGFRAEGLLAVPIGIDSRTYASGDSRRAFFDALIADLESLPGVSGVAAVNRLPLSGGNVLVGIESEGGARDADQVTVDRRVAWPGYFELMRTRLLEGRDFAPADDAGAAGVAIVNEAFLRRVWPDGGGPGRRLRLMLRGGPGPWLEVVGVAADVRHHGLDRPPEPEVFVPYRQAAVEAMTVLVRTPGDPRALAGPVRAAVWRLDPDIPLDEIAPVDRLVAASVDEPRFRTVLLNGFAALALALASIGIYGLVSYTVARRTRETGVRLALGARPRDELGRVLREGVTLALWGVLVGMLGAWALGRVLSGFLFGVEPGDGVTLAGVSGLVLIVAAAATLVPALRAARIPPAEAIRGEA